MAQKKALYFALGLNEPLRGLAMSHIPLGVTFESLVSMALLQEEDKNVKKKVKTNEFQGKKANSMRCRFCGIRGHIVLECRKKRKRCKCFNYGEFGRFTKDCPKKQGKHQIQHVGPSGGRVHPLNAVLPTHDRGSVSVGSLVYISDFSCACFV